MSGWGLGLNPGKPWFFGNQSTFSPVTRWGSNTKTTQIWNTEHTGENPGKSNTYSTFMHSTTGSQLGLLLVEESLSQYTEFYIRAH